MRLALIAALLLSLAGCQDDFTIDGADASADVSTLDVSELDAASADGGPQDDAAMTDAGAEDAAISDATTDVTRGDSAVDPACTPPWLYYLVQSDDEAPYVARYSITASGTARCANLSGGDAIADLASSALVVDGGTMILAGPETLQQLDVVNDEIMWTISTDLDFSPIGHIALFDVGATSFGVGWDQDGPSLGGVSVRAISDGATQRELDVNWTDATAAPERAGDLWIVGRNRLGRNVAQRYVVGSQSAIEEIDVSASRISTVGERLVITTSAGYRFYALEEAGPAFVDSVFLPSAECRIVDTVGHPFRDEAVFVGCGADGNVDSVRIHNRTSESYETVPGSLAFEETALSLSLYAGR